MVARLPSERRHIEIQLKLVAAIASVGLGDRDQELRAPGGVRVRDAVLDGEARPRAVPVLDAAVDVRGAGSG